jgi:peptidoglycan/xylan/chitin deacetylase (PgdA/CDA1 family)
MLVPLLIIHGVASAAVGVAMYGTFVPSSRVWGRMVLRAPPSAARRGVTLTFDDGPTEGPTDRILDLLGEAGVRATFFVIGRNCARFPRLVERMHAEGHLVANHTWDHAHSGWRGLQGYWDAQIQTTNEEIARIIGRRPAMFRPPMGHKTCFTLRAARKAGCQVIGWSHRARDGVITTAPEILERFVPIQPGDILLLHDGIEPNSPGRNPEPTIEALPTLIARLRESNLGIERLDDLLGLPGYQ